MRALIVIIAAGLICGMSAMTAPPAAARTRTCIATNVTDGETYGPGGGRVLSKALIAAEPGDTIVVKGRCVGLFTIDKDLDLVGKASRRTGVPMLIGRVSGPTLTVHYPAQVSLTGLTITHTSSGGDAGTARGLLNSGGMITMIRSTVSGNGAENGGGIFNDGELTLIRSTVSDNTARNGGGIYNVGKLVLRYSTLAGNSATYDGGGVYQEQSLLLSHSTVGANRAGWTGGGLYLTRPDDEVFEASVVAANSAGASGPDCAGEPRSNGYNLIGDTDGFFCAFTPVVGDQVGSGGGLIDALLMALAINGGRTQTMALSPGSPAIDTIPVGALGANGTTVLCPSTGARDQRGVAQPQGVACDTGSFEVVK